MSTIITSVKDVLSKITFLPNDELKLAIIGGIATIVIFLVALLISSGSKMNALRRRIIKFITTIAKIGRIDESNADKVYDEMKKLPEQVGKGWGRFLDERVGYPSDYIVARDCIGSREYSGKNTAGKVLFSIFGVIVWAATAILTAGVCADDLSAKGFSDFVGDFAGVASILSAILVPVAVFVIFYFVLQHVYTKQRKRLEMSFASLQDLLDEKVFVEEREQAPYETETIEELSARVDALIAGRMEDEEPIEVLALPDGIEEELPEEPEEEPKAPAVDDGLGDIEYPEEDEALPEEETPVEETAPEEEPIPEAPEQIEETPEPEPIILTKEEEERYLSILPVVVDKAIEDPDTTNDDLEELAEMIENARINNFDDPKDQAILIDCLQRIADKYYAS